MGLHQVDPFYGAAQFDKAGKSSILCGARGIGRVIGASWAMAVSTAQQDPQAAITASDLGTFTSLMAAPKVFQNLPGLAHCCDDL